MQFFLYTSGHSLDKFLEGIDSVVVTVTAQNGWHRLGIHNNFLKERKVGEHKGLSELNCHIISTEGHYGEGNNEAAIPKYVSLA